MSKCNISCRSSAGQCEVSQRYNLKRTPSYCDRMLYTPKGEWQMKKYQVLVPDPRFASSGVFHSDHDIVAGEAVARNSNDRMLIVTFNCEGMKVPPVGHWGELFKFIETKMNKALSTYSAIVFCLQESGMRNPLKFHLQSYLGSTHQTHSSDTMSVPFAFSVRCIVALKMDRYRSARVSTKSVCLKVGCVKSGASVVVRPQDARDGPGFVAVSAHLPFSPKSSNLGFEERKIALQKLYRTLLVPHLDLWGLVGGDLNFRVSTLNRKNELTGFLRNIGGSKFQEFASPGTPGGLTSPTCKLRKC
jgi:invasion protein IalB